MLPDRFVLKTNHGSGNNYVVRDKRRFLQSGEKIIAKAMFDFWMQMDYGFDDGFELHYSLIEPLIFAEKYMDAFENSGKEYRFLCFAGKPMYCKVKTVLSSEDSQRNIYDLDWNMLDVEFGHKMSEKEPRPEQFEEMIEIARLLCKGFHFVRVDLNVIGKDIYFGEMTFTSASGYTKIIPESFDYELGELIKLPQMHQ